MSERFERTGLFIVCWGKKNRDTKEASEREPGARLGLFSSSVRASVASAQLLFACNLVAQVTHWEGWVDGRTERRGVVLGGLFGMWRGGGGDLEIFLVSICFSPRLHLKAGLEVAVKIFFKPELAVLNPYFTNQKGSMSLLIALILECKSEIYSSSGIVF